MNPFKPVKTIVDAVTFPFEVIFVVGICFVINWMTSPGVWWVQWVALGMGIALISKWAKALKTLAGAAVVGGAGYALYRWFQQRGEKKSASPVNSTSTATTN